MAVYNSLCTVILGAEAKQLRKATLSLVISVRRSACLQGTVQLPPDRFPWALYFEYEGWNFNSGNYLFTTDTK